MLTDKIDQTMPLVSASLKRARGDKRVVDHRAPQLFLESLGISEAEKEGVARLANQNDFTIDPVVSYIVGATSGRTYKHLIGKLNSYPIPDLNLPTSKGELFLDLGCNWGRWSIAAARKGYSVVGLDPSLGAIMAARRVAKHFDLSIKYVVGDARYLPFKKSSFDTVYSYSVFQHLSKSNVKIVLSDVSRILKPGSISLIQMPNYLGIRNLQNQIRRGFREARSFEVRYWSIPELDNAFSEKIGKSKIFVDCYFGLGLQKSDAAYMPLTLKLLIKFSEFLKKISHTVGALKYIADSVFIKSTKPV